MQTRKQSKIESLFRETRILPSTFNAEKRTVDVVFSTGAQVKRQSFFEGTFFEELSMKRDAVRLDRLKNGASVLNNHRAESLTDVIGVVERASLLKGEGLATLRFSEREDVAGIMQDVKDGIIRNISVGYRVHEFEERTETVDGMEKRILRATDWEPMELSFVTIPADAGAQVRSQDPKDMANEVAIVREEGEKPSEEEEAKPEGEEEKTSEEKPEGDADKDGNKRGGVDSIVNLTSEEENMKVEKGNATDLESARKEILETERKRISEITEAVRLGGLETNVLEKFIADGISIEDVRKEVIAQIAAKQNETSTRSGNVELTKDEGDKTRDGLRNALTQRFSNAGVAVGEHKLDDNGKRFINMPLMEMARRTLDDRNHSLSVSEVVARAMHSTSDFPEILADSMGKTLRSSFDELPVTFDPFVRRVSTPDFKQISRTRLSDLDSLEETPEKAEYKGGSMSEEAEKYVVKKYGKIVCFSREMLINDDLAAFAQIGQKMGRAARKLESDVVWSEITTNANMADGNALFSAAHNNLAGVAAALAEGTLSDGRAAMRLQQDLRGEPLNISPVYLYVPAALETTAQKLIASVTPEQTANVNPFNFLQVGVEPRLDADSATAWYLMGSLAMTDMIELATLEGQGGPNIAREDSIKNDGITWRVRHEIGVKAIDYRGLYKNAGA